MQSHLFAEAYLFLTLTFSHCVLFTSKSFSPSSSFGTSVYLQDLDPSFSALKSLLSSFDSMKVKVNRSTKCRINLTKIFVSTAAYKSELVVAVDRQPEVEIEGARQGQEGEEEVASPHHHQHRHHGQAGHHHQVHRQPAHHHVTARSDHQNIVKTSNIYRFTWLQNWLVLKGQSFQPFYIGSFFANSISYKNETKRNETIRLLETL